MRDQASQGLLVVRNAVSGEQGHDPHRRFVLVAELHPRLWMSFSVVANHFCVRSQLALLQSDVVSHLYQFAPGLAREASVTPDAAA
jgi:hypothetical protein